MIVSDYECTLHLLGPWSILYPDFGWEGTWKSHRQREVCMGQATKWLTTLWLPFHWLDLSHMTIPNHKGGWEI